MCSIKSYTREDKNAFKFVTFDSNSVIHFMQAEKILSVNLIGYHHIVTIWICSKDYSKKEISPGTKVPKFKVTLLYK